MNNSTNDQQNTPVNKAKKAAYTKQWRLDNKEKITAYYKQWRLDNKAKNTINSKQWYLDNKDILAVKHTQYYLNNKAKIAIKQKQYRLNNKNILTIKRKQYSIDNKAKIAVNSKQYNLNNKAKNAVNSKQYHLNNKAKIAVKQKQYYLNNKAKIAGRQKLYVRQRLKTDLLFSIKRKLRSLVCNAFKRIGKNKPARTEQLLGCTWIEAKAHFESLFQEGMRWENHGVWHIDHIRPVASFKADELYLMNHISNLQPLWAEENLGPKKVFDKTKWTL